VRGLLRRREHPYESHVTQNESRAEDYTSGPEQVKVEPFGAIMTMHGTLATHMTREERCLD